jgi:hypothetical protein
MEVIRNYPNQVFHEEGDYAVFRRALLRDDVQFLREDFTGDVDRVCLVLRQYVDLYKAREMAEQPFRENVASLIHAGIDMEDMDNERLTAEQETTLELLHKEFVRCVHEAQAKRNEFLRLIYANQPDSYWYTNGNGVNEANNL